MLTKTLRELLYEGGIIMYYAVKKGRTEGIFDNWKDCSESVNGFPGAEYKRFSTKEEAEAYLEDVDIIIEAIKEDIKNGYAVAFCDGSVNNGLNLTRQQRIKFDPPR